MADWDFSYWDSIAGGAGEKKKEDEWDFNKWDRVASGEPEPAAEPEPTVGTGRSFGPDHYNYNRTRIDEPEKVTGLHDEFKWGEGMTQPEFRREHEARQRAEPESLGVANMTPEEKLAQMQEGRESDMMQDPVDVSQRGSFQEEVAKDQELAHAAQQRFAANWPEAIGLAARVSKWADGKMQQFSPGDGEDRLGHEFMMDWADSLVAHGERKAHDANAEFDKLLDKGYDPVHVAFLKTGAELADPVDILTAGAGFAAVKKALASVDPAAAARVAGEVESVLGKVAGIADAWRAENPHVANAGELGDLMATRKLHDETLKSAQDAAARIKKAKEEKQFLDDVLEAELITDGGAGLARTDHRITEDSIRARMDEGDPEVLKAIAEEKQNLAAERVTEAELTEVLGKGEAGKEAVWGGTFNPEQIGFIRAELLRLGAEKLEYVGRGGFSHVFDIGGGKVAKISHYQLTDSPIAKNLVDENNVVQLDPVGRVRKEHAGNLDISKKPGYEPYITRTSHGETPGVGAVDEQLGDYVEIGIMRKLDVGQDVDGDEIAERLLDRGINAEDLRNKGGQQVGTNPWTGERTLVDHMPESTSLDDTPVPGMSLPGDGRSVGKNKGRLSKAVPEEVTDPLADTAAKVREALTEVPGIGAKRADEILAKINPEELRAAIESGDMAKLKELGIGKKLANNIKVKLDGRLGRTEMSDLPSLGDRGSRPPEMSPTEKAVARKARASERKAAIEQRKKEILAEAKQAKLKKEVAKERLHQDLDTRTATQKKGKAAGAKPTREHVGREVARTELEKAVKRTIGLETIVDKHKAEIRKLRRVRAEKEKEFLKEHNDHLPLHLEEFFAKKIAHHRRAMSKANVSLDKARLEQARAARHFDEADKLPEARAANSGERSLDIANEELNKATEALSRTQREMADLEKKIAEARRRIATIDAESPEVRFLDGEIESWEAAFKTAEKRAAFEARQIKANEKVADQAANTARAKRPDADPVDPKKMEGGQEAKLTKLREEWRALTSEEEFLDGLFPESYDLMPENRSPWQPAPEPNPRAGEMRPGDPELGVPDAEPRIKQEDMKLVDPLEDQELRDRVVRRLYPDEASRRRVLEKALGDGGSPQAALHRLVQRLDTQISKATTPEGAAEIMMLRDRLAAKLDMKYGKIHNGKVRLLYDGLSLPDALDVVPLKPKDKGVRRAAAQIYTDLINKVRASLDDVMPTQIDAIDNEALGLADEKAMVLVSNDGGQPRVLHATTEEAWREAFKLSGRDPLKLAYLEPGDLHHLSDQQLRERHAAVWELMRENGLGPWKKENIVTQAHQQKALEVQAKLARGAQNSPKEGRILRGEVELGDDALEAFIQSRGSLMARNYEKLTPEERALHDLHAPMQVEQVQGIADEVASAGVKVFDGPEHKWRGPLKRKLAEWFHRTKGLPREIFEQITTKDRVVRAVQTVTQRHADTMDQSIRAYARAEGMDAAEVRGQIRALITGLNGPPETVRALAKNLPQELVDQALVARKHMDALTLATIAEMGDVLSPEMIKTMRGNLGSYMIRQYRAEVDGWKVIDPHLPTRFHGKGGEAGSQQWQDTIKWMVEQNKGELSPEMAADELHAFLQQGKSGQWDPSLILKEGPGSIKGRQLKKRTELPKPLRELLGEIDDPVVGYFETVNRLTQDLETHRMYRRMKEIGADTLFFERPTGAAGTQIMDPVAGANPLEHRRQMTATSGPDEKNAVAKLVSRGGDDFVPVMGPLDGMFTYDDVADAFKRYNLSVSAPLNKLYRVVMQANGGVKVGKTVGGLGPAIMRNFSSAGVHAVMGGTNPLNFPRLIKAWQLTNPLNLGMGPKAGHPLKALHLEMTKLGVLGDGANFGEFMFHAQMAKGSGFLGDVTDKFVPTLSRAIGKTWEFAKQAYATGDDFWKAVVYLDELDRMKKLNPDMSEQAAKLAAARKTTERMPTYSQTPEAVNILKKQPIVGGFVSYSSEVIRTSKNASTHIHQSFKAGHNADAMRRLVGFTAATGWPLGLMYGMYKWKTSSPDQSGTPGLDYWDAFAEEQTALAPLLPPWNQNSMRPTVKTGPDTFSYWALNNYDAFNMLKEPFTAALLQSMQTGDPKILDMAAASAEGFLEDFIGWDVAFQGMLSVALNEKGGSTSIIDLLNGTHAGTAVTEATAPEQRYKEQMLYLMDHFAPSAVQSAQRLGYALLGEERHGRRDNLGYEVINWATGIRLVEVDVPTSMAFEGRRIKSKYQDMTRAYNRELKEAAGSPHKALEVKQKYRAQYEQYVQPQVTNLVNAGLYHGYDPARVYTILAGDAPYRYKNGEPQRAAGLPALMVKKAMQPDLPWNPY